MIDEEENDTEGTGDRCRAFVNLIELIWEQGRIPQQMTWLILVLLPKGGGDYCGIGILKPFWKVVEVIMDKRL